MKCYLNYQYIIFCLFIQDIFDVIAGFRKGHTLFPHSEKTLEAGDKLLAIVSPRGKEELTEYISTV